MPVDTLPATFPPPFEIHDTGELAWLLRAERAGVPVAPMVVVPVAVETVFYQLNNLPERLRLLFGGVASDDPDEDDLEELVPEAMALVLEHALLEDVVESVYQALEGLPERVLVRRAGSQGRPAWRGREVLLALKRTWAEDWTLDALVARLRAGRGLAPQPRAVLVHDAAVTLAIEPLGFGPEGTEVQAWHDPVGRLARLALARE